ncbi:MAG: RDD family protein [Armatimonadota bacterium]|nr:RDD family protein [bacterium]
MDANKCYGWTSLNCITYWYGKLRLSPIQAAKLELLARRVAGFTIDRGFMLFLVAWWSHSHIHRLWPPLSVSYGFPGSVFLDVLLGFAFGLPIVKDMIALAIYVVVTVSVSGGTIGMRIAGVSMQGPSGCKPGVFRTLGWYILAHISLAAIGAGYLASLTDRQGRTWHDRLAGINFVTRQDVHRTRDMT